MIRRAIGCLILACLLLSPLRAWAVDYTSNASGSWGTSTIWTPNGVPGNGDTVTILHTVTLDSSRTIGTSPTGAFTYVVTVKAQAQAAHLIIPTGLTLTVRGPILNWSVAGSGFTAIIDVNGTGVLQVDNTQSTAQVNYAIYSGNANNDPCQLNLNGTDATHRATLQGVVGTQPNNAGAAALYPRIYDGTSNSGAFTWSWGNVNHVGDASTFAMNVGYATGNSISVSNTSFDTCGEFKVGVFSAGATVSFSGANLWTNTTSTFPLELLISGGVAKSGGTRTIAGCVFDKQVELDNSKDVTFSGDYFAAAWVSGGQATSNWASMTGCFIRFPSSGTYLTTEGNVDHCYLLWDTDGMVNPHGLKTTDTFDMDISYCVFEVPFEAWNSGDLGDMIGLPSGSPGSLRTYNLHHNIILPISTGWSGDTPAFKAVNASSGTIATIAGGVTNVHANVHHNTWPLRWQPGNGMLAVAEGSAGVAGTFPQIQDNIGWDATLDGSLNSYAVNAASSGTDNVITPAGVSNNCWYNAELVGPAAYPGKTNNGTSYNTSTTGSAPGASDIAVNPTFVGGTTRRFALWAVTQGSASGTEATKIADGLGYVKANPALIVSDLIPYIRNGFAPTNAALRAAGHDGSDIGAVAGVFGIKLRRGPGLRSGSRTIAGLFDLGELICAQ